MKQNIQDQITQRLTSLLSRKFFLTVGLNITIIAIAVILFSINVGFHYNENGMLINRVPMLSEDGFLKLLGWLMILDGGYIGINSFQKLLESIGVKINNGEQLKSDD